MDSMADFHFELPEELIAQEPIADRDSSRLLCLPRDPGQPLIHRQFREIQDLLHGGDVLVLNETLVTARRLFGHRPSGAAVEALVFAPTGEPDCFRALMRPAKRLKVGAEIVFRDGLTATVTREEKNGFRTLKFAGADIIATINRIGEIPLPHYIQAHLNDSSRYQTVYAESPGSAAAPTAGLHFTSRLLENLQAKGVQIARVSLDVSIDTFRPVTAERVEDHVMHGETCRISPQAAETINSRTGRVIAVGTTSCRTLESFADGKGGVLSGEKSTQIFIRPGVQMQVVDGLITNFHMPQTTMLLMIAAMVGRERLMEAYEVAISERYRMLSFGDAMLIL
jgi:S-adenosylmethionine:tRNA ribosyltransferase-isomerase